MLKCQVARDIADLVSNIQYADGTDAQRLTLELNSVFEVDPRLQKSLTIDIRCLLSETPEISEGILNSRPKNIIAARAASKDAIVEGWSLIKSGEKDQALAKFNEGYGKFITEIVERDLVKRIGPIEFVDNTKTGRRGLLIPKSVFLKSCLKSIDKFINFE